MPRTPEEIATDLDAAEAADKLGKEIDELEAPEEEDDDNQDPPGYMTHDEWITAGKDPDDYKGKNAYKATYESIQTNKALKTEMQGMKTLLTDVVDAAEATRLKQAADHKVREQAILDEKMDTMEPKEAIAEQRKIDAIDDTPKVQINPVITTFITQNPILDPQSPDYNADFAADHISFHNAGADAMGGRNATLSDGQVLRIMTRAYADAKELNKELFLSSRNKRGGNNRARNNKTNTQQGKLSEYRIDDEKDSRNQGAAQAMYDMIKKKSPKKAEEFKAKLLGV